MKIRPSTFHGSRRYKSHFTPSLVPALPHLCEQSVSNKQSQGNRQASSERGGGKDLPSSTRNGTGLGRRRRNSTLSIVSVSFYTLSHRLLSTHPTDFGNYLSVGHLSG